MSHDDADEACRLRQRNRIVFGMTTLLLGVVGVVLLATPAFKRVMDERQLQLPTPTKALIGNYHLAPFVVLGWWVTLAMVRQAERSRKVATLFSRVSLVVAFFLAGAAVMAVTMPLVGLLKGLSK